MAIDKIDPKAANRGRLQNTTNNAGERAAGSLADFGRALYNVADQLGKQVEHNYNKNLENTAGNFERARDIYIKETYIPQLANAQTLDEVDSLRSNFDNEINKLGAQFLGEKNYKKFLENDGKDKLYATQINSFDFAAKKNITELDAERILDDKINLAAKQYALMPEGKARDAVKNDLYKSILDERADTQTGQPVQGAFNKKQAAAIMESFDKQAKAELNKNDNMNVLNALEVNPYQTRKDLLAGVYKNLTVPEIRTYLNSADGLIATYDKTAKAQDLEPVLSIYTGIAQTSGIAATEILQQLEQSPASRDLADYSDIMPKDIEAEFKARLKNLSPEKFKTALTSFAEIAARPDLESGVKAINDMARAEIEFDSFKVDNTAKSKTAGQLLKKTNNAKAAPADIKDVILAKSQLDGFIGEGTLITKTNKKKALEMSNQYTKWIGQLIENAEPVNSNWFSTTNDEYSMKLVKQLKQKSGISNDAAGQIYADLYKNIVNQNVNLAATDEESRKKVKNIFNHVVKRNVANAYDVPEGDFTAVVADNKKIDYAVNPNPGAGRPLKGLDGYYPELIDGVENFVKRDARGRIVDIINAERA